MRVEFSIIYMVLIAALAVCSIIAARSGKKNGPAVALLDAALIPPVIGNLIIIHTGDQFTAEIGWYIYLLGMDLVMIALMRFTFRYCRLNWSNKWISMLVLALIIFDVVQILCNPYFGNAFETEAVIIDGYFYYRAVPLLGQTFHRMLDYGLFFAVLVIFLVKMVRAPKIYSERFSVILATMVLVGCWETMYIFSRTPVDRAMIGFAVYGLLVFYFSIYYRPMRLLDRMLSNVAQGMTESLFFFDAIGRCIWANAPGLAMTGVEDENFELAAQRLRDRFGDLGEDRQEWALQHVTGKGDDARYYVLERHAVIDNRGRADGTFLSIRDNTEDQRALRREIYNNTHDRLTGLYTKEFLFERVEVAVQTHPEKKWLIAFLNVNDFKLVNDIFGHTFGDYALQRIADWVRQRVTDNGIYGRLGGDTFGLCMPVEDFDAESIEQELSDFIISDGTVEHPILIHLGVYELTEEDMDVPRMYDRARLALSTIRDTYHKHIAYYDNDMRDRVLWNQHITNQLPTALAEGQLQPYLQPIVGADGKVLGAEALVRWIHPEDGFLPPARFIPVFERNGMIAEVDRYMWRSACDILSCWKEKGLDLFLSVNISPKDFYFMDVPTEIRNIVREYDIDPSMLRIEITETVMMTDIEKRVRILNELKGDGFYVEMDDFGSGYSSLNLLKDMPVDLIKIDMAFLEKSVDEQKAETILRNIITLSDELGIKTLTEGVETQPQRKMLTEMGCKLFQGYLFAKPMPLNDFEDFCSRGA